MSDLFEEPRIKCLSLWQPWASLWLESPRVKLHETRHFRCPPTAIGLRILVHAAQRRAPVGSLDAELEQLCARRFGSRWRDQLPHGAAVGTIFLSDCRPTTSLSPASEDYLCGDWSPGRYAWEGLAPVLLPTPLPMKGRQGWWSVTEREVGL